MAAALFTTHGVVGSMYWRPARDGDRTAAALYRRHYSARRYADGRRPALFVGPGQKCVLVAHDDTALLVWRVFISRDDQVGINCAVFRNEGPALASALILDAEAIAWARWPDHRRLYTYVDPAAIASRNPGYCFQVAGWTRCGWTIGGHGRPRLLILDKRQETSQ